MSDGVILALDQGTTSSRTLAIALDGSIVASAQEELPQIYPRPGWVEHDPEVIWKGQLRTAGSVAAQLQGRPILSIGLTNQRETTIIWDRRTGMPIHNAIVWQDRRTAETTSRLKSEGFEDLVSARTGLVLDPYFSATKIAWILDHVDGARDRAVRGDLAFGTVDSWLIWNLTGGEVHATDATNAARTSLFDIHTQNWDAKLCELFRVPMTLLPEVKNCADDFGATRLLGTTLQITGCAGDQQAAAIGQACLSAGDAKCTYGTGAFLILNTGDVCRASTNRLLSTVAYRLDGVTAYAQEGAILTAGAAIQWLRDGLGIIRDGVEAGDLATTLEDNGGVYLVPALTGLGAPHWDAGARGLITGLTRGASRAHLARAALEAAAYQTHDLVTAMAADGADLKRLRIDGGMAANNWFSQFLADVLSLPVDRPVNIETTAQGAAILAALGSDVFGSIEEALTLWKLDRSFEPAQSEEWRVNVLAGWRTALLRTLSA